MIRTQLLRVALSLTLALSWAVTSQAQAIFNGGAITIPTNGTASPYPSTINVSNYTGTITEIRVTLTGFSHGFTDDIGALFVGPTGARTVLFTGAGTDADPGFQAVNLNLTFRDGAATTLPQNSSFTSGEYKPGLQQYVDNFSPPAPQGAPHPTNFSAFNGTNPNGTYSLYVEDFVGSDSGSISSWSITIFGITPVPEPSSILLGAAGFGMAGAAIRRRWKAKRI